jgi:hypothetical protein
MRVNETTAAWFDVSCGAAALMGGMLLVMWAQRPSSSCTLAPEALQRLVLSRETDREHLTRDLASAARIARRYTASTSSDAQQHSRLLECQATLIQQIATRHGVPPNRLQASAQ